MSISHERRQFIRKLRSAGLEVQPRDGGHYKVTHPELPGSVFIASSPSDLRAWKNARSRVNRIFKTNIK